MKRTAAFCAVLLAGAAAAQDQTEAEFARSLLADLQALSFRDNREYCGTIGVDGGSRLVASRPRRGGRDGCRPTDPRGVDEVIASFHTHAAFDEAADSELPSIADVLGDMAEGLDGYLATPGGRFWFIDGATGSMRQICGPGCLPSDPAYKPGLWGKIRKRYSLSELERRAARF